MSDWVEYLEGFPPPKNRLVMTWSSEFEFMGDLFHNGENWCRNNGNGSQSILQIKIDYWQDLPKPPG